MTNQFRAAVLAGKTPGKPDQLLAAKAIQETEGDDLANIEVARAENRVHNHRWNDRHRLTEERAEVQFRGETLPVELINLSSGGAMIRSDFEPRLWERVDLVLGEGCPVECAVRWIRRDHLGLEFAHETQINCEPGLRNQLLLNVLQRSFPELELQSEAASSDDDDLEAFVDESPASDAGASSREAQRHPMIWSGEIHYDHSTEVVRLRNISESGALIDSDRQYPDGVELLLDLGAAGQIFSRVAWTRGMQAGLKFEKPFDLRQLSLSKPAVTPQRWVQPNFLKSPGESDSPWTTQWQRASLSELRDELEGYMKY